MTVSFRVGRYLLALLWHWSIPFVLGGVFASVLALQGVQEGVDLLDEALDASISRVADACALGTDPPERRSPPVSGAGLPVAGAGGETG
ncbi:hypothetical protein HP532_09675 [Pseudomonas sp. CrR25]|nr:hypothetical protein [Pseudomonas sp. CrR25]